MQMEIRGAAKFHDAYVGDVHRDAGYGDSPYLCVGTDATLGITRSLMQFDLSAIPEGSTIHWARLSIFHSGDDPTPVEVGIHPVTTAWRESGVTWADQPEWGPRYSAQTLESRGWYDFWMTQIVADWCSGRRSNYGIGLKAVDESQVRRIFYSSDYTEDPALLPSLTIDYTPPEASPAIEEYRGFWVDQFHAGAKTPDQVDQLLADAKTAKANAIFLQVRRRGDAYYNHSMEPRTEDPALAEGFDPLADLITKARGEGMEVHAWFSCMKIWNQDTPPVAPDHLFNRHGDAARGTSDYWLSEDANGDNRFQGEAVVDPGHPASNEHLIDVLCHVAENYEIDGVMLDLVRYMGEDWGYNPTALQRYQKQTGVSVPPAPTDANWMTWRRRQVDQLVRKAYVRLLSIKPKLKVSVAVITWGDGPASEADWERTAAMTTVFQDWRTWMEQGWVDMTIPMNYFDESRWAVFYDHWIEWAKNHQYGRISVNGVGIYLNTIDHSLTQIEKGLTPSSAGKRLAGTGLYSYAVTNRDGISNGEFYRALTQGTSQHPDPPFQGPARPPTLQWKENPKTGHVIGRLRSSQNPDRVFDGTDVEIEGAVQRAVSTDGHSDFAVVDLPPGEYVATCGGSSQSFTITAGRVTEVTVEL